MFKDKSWIWKSFFTSTLFLIFLKPLAEYCWDILVGLLSITFKMLLDQIFVVAARSDHFEISRLMFFVVLGFVTGLVFGIGTRIIRISRSAILKKLMDGKTLEEKKEIIFKYKSKANPKVIQMLLDSPKRAIITAQFSKVYFLFIFIYFSADYIFPSQLASAFNQRITAIEPYVIDQDMKLIRSRWALMKSYEDFKSINSTLDSIAKKNYVELPSKGF